MSALDAIWDNPDSTPTPNGGSTRKCRRHVWHPATLALPGAPADGSPQLRSGFVCDRCGAQRDAARTRTNRNNRKRGNRTSHDVAAYLGGRNVEALKLPWDVEAAGAHIQSKRLKARPSVAEIVRLVAYIDAGPSLRALYWVGAGQRVASGHVFVLLREWVGEHGWMGPSGASFLSAGEIVIELPVALFREMRGGTG